MPVAHNIFGVAQTINSANYVYFCALKELSSLRSSAAITIYTGESPPDTITTVPLIDVRGAFKST